MERSEYDEYLEFKEFQRMRQEKNSQAVGRTACTLPQQPRFPTPKRQGREDTMDHAATVTRNYDRQGNYEGESW